MPSPQELQNALMLKKANPNLTTAQAVNQSRVPVTATSQINQDQLAKNQALRQAPQVPATPITPTGTTTPSGATLNANGTIANAPLPTEQQINAQYGGTIQDNGLNSVQPKIEQAPVTQTAPVKPTKVEPVIDFNKSQGREQDIQTNIKQITTDNPALLKDRNAYNQAFGYDTADQGKKAMLDASFNTGNQVPTASAMYNNIVAKADIPEEMKQTPSYRIANNRYMKANMYSTMTPSQLSSEMTNSKLIQGSQAYEDLKAMNPKLVQDTENLRIVNGSKQNIFTTVNNPDGTPVKVNNLEESFKSDFEDNFGDFIKQMYAVQTPEQIRAIIYTPDAQQANDKATAIELEMNELEKQIDNVDSDVDTEMKGSGATGSRIALEKAIRKDKLEKSYNSALKNYTTYANKANSIINQNTTIFQEQQKQQQQQNAAMLPFLQDQYKTEQEKIKAQEALNDPATQIGATMKQFEDLGIVSQGDIGSKLQEFKDSGLTLPEYLKGLRKLYMEKPEYQQILAQQKGKGISYQTIGDKVYRQNADGSLTETTMNPNKSPDAKSPVWQEWTDANGVKHAEWLTPGVNPTTNTGTKATGNIVPVTAGNKTVRLDQVGATGFESAINQLTTAGIPIVVGQGARDQSATIKSMADRYGIAFNASNPAETAQKLRSAGHQVADPGKSNHESGMAIDVYGDSKLGKVSTAQEKILNANGWYSAGIPGDAGHFEYRGGGTSGTQANTKIGGLGQFMKDNQDRGTGYSNDDVKAFNEKIDRLVSAGDENGMAIAYRNMVMKDKDFKKEFDDTKSFTTALDTVQKLIDDYEKSGKDSNKLKAIAESVGRKLGMTTDTALAQLQTQMGTTMANYIKSISGTAASDAEVQRLMGNMANIGNVEELNTAIISQVKQNALNGIKSMIDTRMYGMPEDLKPQVFGDVYGSTKGNTKLSALSQILANVFKNAPKQ